MAFCILIVEKFLSKGKYVPNPTVLVISNSSLLNQALKNIIADSKLGLEVIESAAQEYDELISEINTFIADVILLDKASSFATDDVLGKLLLLCPKLFLILVDQQSNWLHLYRREDILLTSSTDLMELVRSSINVESK